MSQRHKMQVFILLSIIMAMASAATGIQALLFAALGLLAVVIVSDLIFGG